MNPIYILLLLLVTFICNVTVSQNTLQFKSVSSTDGLPNNMIHQIYQDNDNTIWIATYFGLIRYDGYEFLTFKSDQNTPNLLCNNNVLCIKEDYNHQLWIGTHEGLTILNKSNGSFRNRIINGINKNRLNSILVASDSSIYLGYIRGLAYYDSLNDSIILMTSENCLDNIPEQVNIQSLIEDKNGYIWIGTWQNGIYRYNPINRKFTHFRQLNKTSFLSSFIDSEGSIWMGSDGDGLFKIKNIDDSLSIINYKHTEPTDHIYSISEDIHTHSLWLSTRNGINIMPLSSEGIFTNYCINDPTHYLPTQEVNSILRDRNHLMWLGTKGTGFFIADTRKHPFHTFNNDKPDESVSTLYIEPDNAAWIGYGYGVDYIHGNKSTTLIHTKRPYRISYSTFYDEILLAVHDEGIITCRNGKRLKQYRNTTCNFIPHNLVSVVYEDRQGNWWVGTHNGLGVRYANGTEICLNRLNDLLDKEIIDIIEDRDSSLWLATANNGIIRLFGEMNNPHQISCQSYTLKNKTLPVNTPLCLYSDSRGQIWCGTEGSGLCLYNRVTDSFESVHQHYNLPGDMAVSIEEDNNAHLWIGTDKGLARISLNQKQEETRIFTVADNLTDNFFTPNASFFRNGTLYFGSGHGITYFNPNDIEEKTTPVTLNISDILIDGTSWQQLPQDIRQTISATSPNLADTITLLHTHTSITIRFASLTYLQPQQNRYAYRLSTIDTAWNYTTTDRKAQYTNLPSGHYTFELRATNENGQWSTFRFIHILVRPSFWTTPWAYTCYILIFLTLTTIFYLEARRHTQLQQRLRQKETEAHQLLSQKETADRNFKKQFSFEIHNLHYTDADEEFMQKAIACVNRHLSDSDFDIPQFIEEMSISRTTLYNKLKSLTGLNTTGFIRNVRLKTACKLMDETRNIRISDLAYQVGFNDPKYFSICFKKEFGLQPTEYMEQYGKK